MKEEGTRCTFSPHFLFLHFRPMKHQEGFVFKGLRATADKTALFQNICKFKWDQCLKTISQIVWFHLSRISNLLVLSFSLRVFCKDL